MVNTLPLFIILVASVVFSALVRRLHVPWVLALLLGGVAIGPHGFDLVRPDDTLSFLGELGLIFLMFMAGLETRLSTIKKYERKIVSIALLNGSVPFVVAILIGMALGYDMIHSLVLGIIFISSSIAVIIPILEAHGLLRSALGRVVVGVAILEDIISLIALSVLLQLSVRAAALPLPVFYILLLAVLLAIRWLVPKLRQLVGSRTKVEKELFQQDLRVVFALLIGVVVVFELLGLHSIIAGFFAGFVLSEGIRSRRLKDKIHAIGYGIFIPIFFILLGAGTDFSALLPTGGVFSLALVIIIGSLLSKFFSGWIGGRLAGFSNLKSTFIGAATTPQLSTTLAAAITAGELGLLDKELVTAIIALSVVTTLAGPLAVRALAPRIVHSGVS
jgi:Kef-type K+ transport system membrane component KefB